ncbi:UPF0481 protein At3g47200-like [Humulus lupulus]|uniref:UPF0481 protein At3g47200-like n=1 Tax=Humulus lupulus TaxID=3486 RepID=UPI002B401C41|nr:UPF0481 protein At3g47200-like [Humulus lupulus]XP_062105258.1 UPF0481 protein At3g47200-like [Humulus lupulus]
MDEDSIDHNKSVIIDIPTDLESNQWSKCWIHRIPRKLRKVKESAYTPQLISIGPFHHGREELKAMEVLKEKYHQKLLQRLPKDGSVSNQMEEFIRDSYKEIHGRYAGLSNNGFDDEDQAFEKIIMRDACFIVELFQRNDSKKESDDDYILSTPWLKKAIKLDLIMLENQIPFFVLRQLYTITAPHLPSVNVPITQASNHMNPFLKLTCSFFKDHIVKESDWEKFAEIKEIKHFTNLLREFWLPREFIKRRNPQQKDIADRKYLYSATKLDKAGVTFKRASKGTSLADVKISKKPVLKFIPASKGMKLKLPELKLENDTECLLRNVMALEQCLYPKEDYICGYVALMDQLINTSEDVDFLVERKIITNMLGSNKEAARLFNGLCNQIPREKTFYARFYNDLNKFYENRWNVTRSTLKKVYFKDLWTGSSTVVGLFVLVFTVTATIRNVYLRHL